MPLHIPHIFGRSRSRSTGVRTDLCNNYRHTTAERRAQGYSERSDWSNAIELLSDLLLTAVQKPEDIEWDTWEVDKEMADVRRFHFEDLDQTDQMLCPTCYRLLVKAVNELTGSVSAGTTGKLWDVVERLRSFKLQAEQLYGEESCAAMGERLRAEKEARGRGL